MREKRTPAPAAAVSDGRAAFALYDSARSFALLQSWRGDGRIMLS